MDDFSTCFVSEHTGDNVGVGTGCGNLVLNNCTFMAGGRGEEGGGP